MSLYIRLLVAFLFIGTPLFGWCAQATGPLAALPSEAKVLLPDGSLLVSGGVSGTGVSNRAYVINLDGSSRVIVGGMKRARAGHTLTVLPNGKVLVFGGTGEQGGYLRTMEIYDPLTSSFTAYDGPPLVPRSGHTATLLSSGAVAILGGITEGGALARDIQLWDFRTGNIRSIDIGLQMPRQNQTATLDSDGAVLVRGGVGASSAGSILSELMVTDPIAFHALSVGTEPTADDTAPRVEWSEPLDGASSVDLSQYIKLRFGHLVLPSTFTAGNVTLQSADGTAVPGTASLAESGRTGFFIPSTPLTPGTSYVLTLSGLSDFSGNAFPPFTARFQTLAGDDDGSEDGWIPSTQALNGNWNSGTGLSSLQKLPPLKAAAGVTAVAGQALAVSGHALARVTLTIEGKSVKTDETGRFLLRPVSPGHHIMTIDGSTADKRRASYGFFETGVDVKAGLTNVLNYTIWLTRLDTEHAITIPSPTTDADTVVKTPLIPGLELHLPAGTKIISREGKAETTLTITPVPLDKPPFPLPTGLKVPFYFTIQPGGAEIRVPGSGATMKGAQLYYPNGFHEPVGTVYNFWNYDAASKGWYIYGDGQVVGSGAQIVPNAGVYVYELTGAMVGGGDAKPAIGPGPDGPSDGDPVDLASGQFIYHNTDLALPDIIPISLERTYITNDHYQRAFGIGATDNYDIFMVGDTFPYTYQELILPNGTAVRFNRTSPGTSYTDAFYESSALSGYWYGATLWYNQSFSNGFPYWHWLIKTKTGTVYIFPDSQNYNDQVHQALVGIVDPHGNAVTLTRDGNALLTRIGSPSGRFIAINYDASQRISQATDSSGRVVSYSYDTGNHLTSVTDVLGGVTQFTYNNLDLLTSITDPRGTTYLTNTYDSYGRVLQQKQADTGTYLFSWTPSQNSTQLWETSGLPVNRYNASAYEGYAGLIAQASVTSPRGYVHQVTFDNLGRPITNTFASGQPEQQSSTYQYYADNLLSSVIDPLGRTTTFDYDANSNVITVTALSGTANAVTSSATYDPIWNRLASSTDPLGHARSYSYDAAGNLVQVQNALGKSVTFSHDSFGRTTAVTDPLGNSTQFGYNGSELATIKNALGQTTYRFSDNRGNLISIVDPDGNRTSFQFDNANRFITSTDATGNIASVTYDPNGNVTVVQDKAGNQTSFTYDSMDRLLTTTDPLQRTVTLVYDLDGNIVSRTDRKGQVTSSSFDGLSRPTFLGFGTQSAQGGPSYQSTVTYQFDAGSRLSQATDSVSGSITRAYDGLNRLLSENSPQGTLVYTYDAAGRRISAQAGSMPAVTYGYDNVNRPTSIVQGNAQVGISYDDDGRGNSMTLPNGITKTLIYDQASRLQSMAYSYGGTSLGTLSYAYDPAGLRTGIGGSLASTGLPAVLTQATYDAANQVASWNGTAVTYDANGSMLTDVNGNQYSWDARNRLAGVAGNLSMTFNYDAFNRRISKTIGGQTSSYLYDGVNQIAVASPSNATVQLTGGVDEYFLQTDSTGSYVPLTDALGSTLALANSAGQLTSTYQYDSFGNTSEAGGVSGNPLQFAGRENDLDGLYYNRARYYSPMLGRFISQDPTGFAAGLNLYAYAGGNPLSFNDPSGLDKSPREGHSPSPLLCLLFGCHGAEGPGEPGSPDGPGSPEGNPSGPLPPPDAPPCSPPSGKDLAALGLDLAGAAGDSAGYEGASDAAGAAGVANDPNPISIWTPILAHVPIVGPIVTAAATANDALTVAKGAATIPIGCVLAPQFNAAPPLTINDRGTMIPNPALIDTTDPRPY